MLATYLLEANLVDGIVHVKASDGSDEEAQLILVLPPSRTAGDVLAAAGSRYGPTAALLEIESLLASDERWPLSQNHVI